MTPAAVFVLGRACTLGACSAEPSISPNEPWDHDSNPSTACVAWSTYEAGPYVNGSPSEASDRIFAACPIGTFSAVSNAPACTTWSTRPAGSSVTTPGTGSISTNSPPKSERLDLGEARVVVFDGRAREERLGGMPDVVFH